MSKLTRFTQKLFGSTAASNQIAKFGSLAAGTPARYSGSTVTPALIQALGNFLQGWKGAVVGADSPAIEDTNALDYLWSYQLSYLLQAGVAEWDSGTTYYIGSIVNDGTGALYRSLADNNTGNAVTSLVYWVPVNGTSAAELAAANWLKYASSEVTTYSAVCAGQDVNKIPYYIAVNGAGANKVSRSPDGVTWAGVAGVGSSYNAIVCGGSTFVAVGSSGNVMTSTNNGAAWTARTAASADAWRSVAWSGSLFVAVSSDGTVMSSPDGITWTSRTAAAAQQWVSITYGNGLFVAVSSDGASGRAMTSPDGITWTLRTTQVASPFLGVIYGGGYYVAYSNNSAGPFNVSTDGITWTTRVSSPPLPISLDSVVAMAYSNGVFVAITNSAFVITSIDTITWTYRGVSVALGGTTIPARGMCAGVNGMVLVAQGGFFGKSLTFV